MILTFCTLTTRTLSIIPDPQNPLLMDLPQMANPGQDLTLRFSFQEGSAGLIYHQFIAVVFPKKLGDSELFFSAKPIWTCALKAGLVKYTLTPMSSEISPTKSLPAENNIAYCRFDDTGNNLKPGVTYELTLNMGFKITSTNFIGIIGLFTSTSNNAEKIIIDSTPVFGTLGQYGDWFSAPPLQITAMDAPVVTSSLSLITTPQKNAIYPYNVFDLTFSIKCNTFIAASDVYIIFNYPSTIVSAATSVTSSFIQDNNPLKAAIKGTLSLKSFDAANVLIKGIEEDLIPQREFKLTLKGWIALENTNSTDDASFTLYVYYKNTYSVFSASSSQYINVLPTPINLVSINHPEGWDIWRNGAWPMRFVFQPNNDLIKGGYILIQHMNAQDASNKLSFIAATCDFSENDSTTFDNSFGVRPNCFPYRLDHNYPNHTTDKAFPGAGIFFKVNSLLSSKKYYLTLWVFADNCGGNNSDNFSIPSNQDGSSVKYSFQLTVYKLVNSKGLNEKRLDNSSNEILGQSIITPMMNTCWNAIVNGANFSDPTSPDDSTPMEFNSTSANNIFTVDYMNLPISPDGVTTSIDTALYKEIYDWGISATPSSINASGYTADVSSTFTEYFLYGGKTITTDSYFLLRAKLPINLSANVYSYFALPTTAASVDNSQPFYLAKSIFLFSSAWFKKGDLINSSTGCYVSWAWHSSATDSNPNANTPATLDLQDIGTTKPWKNLVFNASQTPYATTTKKSTGEDVWTEFKPNFISSVFNGANMNPPGAFNHIPTIDITSTTLDGQSLKIVSTQMGKYKAENLWFKENTSTTVPTNTWIPMDIDTFYSQVTPSTNQPPSNSSIYLSLFTSCLKWKNTPPAVKSLYTYIDIQWNFSYKNLTNRVNRFIKLYPEGGVFHDYNSKFLTSNLSTRNPLLIHYAYVNQSTMGVCLLELDTNTLSTLGDGTSDTLAIWLFFGSLIEMDYSNTSATYPVAPLHGGINSYGLQSSTPVSKENLYYPDKSLSKFPYITGNLAAGKYGSLDELMGMPKSAGGPSIRVVTQKSFYHILMGSVVILNGIKNANITTVNTINRPSLLIPFYCPYANDSINKYNTFQSEKLPLVFSAWLNMNSHAEIKSLNKYIGYKTISSDTFSVRYTMILNRLYAKSIDNPAGANIIPTVKSNDGLKIPSGGYLANVTLRFNQYTKTASGSDNILYLFNNNLTADTQQTQYCSGHVLFVKKDISVDPNTSLKFGTQVAINSATFGTDDSKATFFYVMGKQFSRAVLSGLNMNYDYLAPQVTADVSKQTDNLTSDIAKDVSAYFWTGIKRRTIDSFVNYATNDYLAYFCTAVTSDLNTLVSNYLRTTSVFVLDYNPDLTANFANTLMTFDKAEPVIKGDIASNFKMTISTPSDVSQGAMINFTANLMGITTNTLCGIVVGINSIAKSCTRNDDLSVSCATGTGGSSFTICCYNIAISDPFSIASLTVSFPTAAYLSNLIYSAQSQITANGNPFKFTSNSDADTNMSYNSLNLYASVQNLTYSHINQEGGYGKATISVNLPREPVRGMKIIFTGDYSGLIINNSIQPRCTVTFNNGTLNNNQDSADILIDTCSVDLSNSSSAISITTKRMIYKCGLSFTRSFNIMLWPVLTSTFQNNSNSYKILMQLNSSEGIANNTTAGFNIPVVKGLDTKPLATQADTLCSVTNVLPKIPGEFGDYTFEFDLDTNKSFLNNATPNEFTIFWPYEYYETINNVVCYYNQALINCSFSDEGILNIRFKESISVGSGKRIQIVVTNIMNSLIDGDISYICTVNTVNYLTQKRVNLLVGSGKLLGGIPAVNQLGALRFLSIDKPVSETNPRAIGTYSFRVTLDRGTGLTPNPLTITNNPYVVITFPKEYNLSWYVTSNNLITANIDSFVNDNTNIVKLSGSIFPSKVVQSGNRIFIYLPDASYTFDNNWRYWEIKLNNIPTPNDNTNSKAAMSLGAYTIFITNDNFSALYKTYTNLNQSSYSSLTPVVDNWLTFYRSNTFTFDNKKWVIDININGVLNKMSINPGRFFKASFNVRNTSSNITASSIIISLVDPQFKTLDQSHLLSSSMKTVPFYLGVPCGTPLGNYILNFSLISPITTPSISPSWAPLSPLLVNIGNTKGTISYQIPSYTPSKGSMLIYLFLSEPSVDLLTIDWDNADGLNNDPSSRINSVNIPIGAFTQNDQGNSNIYATYSNPTALANPQQFKMKDPNTCYTWNINTLTITYQGILNKDTTVMPSFTFYNSDSDANIAKNSIRVNIKYQFTPSYIYCALACLNMDFPTDNDIRVNKSNSDLIHFYSGVYTNTQGQDMLFNGLVRGQKYKLRCILENVAADVTQRASITVTATNFTSADNKIQDIIASNPQPTQCSVFALTSDITIGNKISIIQYCQKVFISAGYDNNGCVVCTDNLQSYISPGLQLSNINSCAGNNLTPVNIDYNNVSTIPSTLTANNITTFTVCAVNTPTCPTNMSAGGKQYSDVFSTYYNNTSTQDLIKKNLGLTVAVNATNTYSDAILPDIESISISNVSSIVSTSVTFTATSTLYLQCKYMLSSSNDIPTFDVIASCSDELCGTVRPNPNGHVVTVTTTKVSFFTKFNVLFACFNDVPFSIQRSAVKRMTSFNTPPDPSAPQNVTSGNVTRDSSESYFKPCFVFFTLILLLI
jgi:hypothetical protein